MMDMGVSQSKTTEMRVHKLEAISTIALGFIVIAAVSGAFGGCAAAAHHVLASQGKLTQRTIFFLSYAIVGAAMGIFVIGAANLFGLHFHTLEQFVLATMAAGFIGSLVLAGTNLTMRFLLKRLGIEVTMTLRKNNENRRKDEK